MNKKLNIILLSVDGCYTEHSIDNTFDQYFFKQNELDKVVESLCDKQHSDEKVRVIRPDTWYKITNNNPIISAQGYENTLPYQDQAQNSLSCTDGGRLVHGKCENIGRTECRAHAEGDTPHRGTSDTHMRAAQSGREADQG
eukprot:16427938-Heterocapsa_arctica.AAC.1